MVKLYHGTHINAALQIGKCGEILSPLQIEIRRLNNIRDKSPVEFDKRFSEGIEKKAYELCQCLYSEEDMKIRVSTVSTALNINIVRSYAEQFDSTDGGILFEISIPVREIWARIKDADYLQENINHLLAMGTPKNELAKRIINGRTAIFFPKKLDLKYLKKLYLTNKAGEYKDLIYEVFKKYKCLYGGLY